MWVIFLLRASVVEIRLPGDVPVTVAVNSYGNSPLALTWSRGTGPMVIGEALPDGHAVEMMPDLSALHGDTELARLCNLYGGSALAFFSPRACYFFADGTACRFCSLGGTAEENDSYASRITSRQVYDAITAVLAADPGRINQVMIVGGNERTLDRGFLNHVTLADAAAQALADTGTGDVSVHLVTMPPRDLSLIGELGQVPGIHVGFNLEVWDAARFAQVAPGKTKDYGHGKILTALQRLRETVGEYRAHSILIAGLEPAQSTLAGAKALAELGISPIINVYHSDRNSELGLKIRPTYRHLVEVAVGLQNLCYTFPIQPYWKGCGRNALDHEACTGLFRSVPLEWPDRGHQ